MRAVAPTTLTARATRALLRRRFATISLPYPPLFLYSPSSSHEFCFSLLLMYVCFAFVLLFVFVFACVFILELRGIFVCVIDYGLFVCLI